LIQPPVGTHCLLELRGCPVQLLDDAAFIRTALTDASTEARSTLLNFTSHRFEPQGVTAVALLAESHISMHTWPELGYAAVDLFTCGEHTDPRAGCELLARRFEADDYTLETVQRGGNGTMRFLPKGKPRARKAVPCPVPN